MTKNKHFFLFLILLCFIDLISINCGKKGKVSKEVERLKSSDPLERADAADELRRLGKNASTAIPFLLELLDDSNELRWVQKSDVAMPYAGTRTSPGQEAARALAEIGKPAINPLINALNNKNLTVQKNVAYALGKIGKPAVEALFEELKNKKSKISELVIINVIKSIRNKNALKALINILNSEDSKLREAAITALGNIPDRRSVEALLRASEDKSPNVRQAAVWGLYELYPYNNEFLIETIIIALNDEDQNVRVTAMAALSNITGEDFGLSQEKWQQWWERNKDKFIKEK